MQTTTPSAAVAVDTVRVVDTIQVISADRYEQVLERSAAQLGTWWTALGVAVAVLAVLVTLGAIVATLILYRQSREYKEQTIAQTQRHESTLATAVEQYEAVLAGFIAESNREIRERLDASILEGEQRLATMTGESREQLEHIMSEMKEKRELINAASTSKPFGSPVDPPATQASQQDRLQKLLDAAQCDRCGGRREFSGRRDPRTHSWILRCQSCGKEAP